MIAMPPLFSGCWATKAGMIACGLSLFRYFALIAAPRLLAETGAEGVATPEAAIAVVWAAH